MGEGKYVPSPKEVAKINEQRKNKVIDAEIRAVSESDDPFREVYDELQKKSVDDIIPSREATDIMIGEANDDDFIRELNKTVETKRRKINEIDGSEYQDLLEKMPAEKKENFEKGRAAAKEFAKTVFKVKPVDQIEKIKKSTSHEKSSFIEHTFSLEGLAEFLKKDYPTLSVRDVIIHLDCYISNSSEFDSELYGIKKANKVIKET